MISSEGAAEMKTKRTAKKKSGKRPPQKIKTVRSRATGIQRRSGSGFSNGIDLERAMLVEESLDERERRG
jgi:hypothetical protein